MTPMQTSDASRIPLAGSRRGCRRWARPHRGAQILDPAFRDALYL